MGMNRTIRYTRSWIIRMPKIQRGRAEQRSVDRLSIRPAQRMLRAKPSGRMRMGCIFFTADEHMEYGCRLIPRSSRHWSHRGPPALPNNLPLGAEFMGSLGIHVYGSVVDFHASRTNGRPTLLHQKRPSLPI